MPDVLVLYASKHGHTAKIAHRIAQGIRDDGRSVDVRDSHSASVVSPADYDAVIVGASIHAGHHQREIVDWAKQHALGLGEKPSAFFSVCLAVADDNDEARATAQKYIDDFADETGWTPSEATTFAGALQYLEYDFFTRTLIRLMMRHQGHPTDTSRDFDYTDWDAVDRFAHEFAARAGGGAALAQS
jgi:menaquinone-dependent protoporphyrinogen oxidase